MSTTEDFPRCATCVRVVDEFMAEVRKHDTGRLVKEVPKECVVYVRNSIINSGGAVGICVEEVRCCRMVDMHAFKKVSPFVREHKSFFEFQGNLLHHINDLS